VFLWCCGVFLVRAKTSGRRCKNKPTIKRGKIEKKGKHWEKLRNPRMHRSGVRGEKGRIKQGENCQKNEKCGQRLKHSPARAHCASYHTSYYGVFWGVFAAGKRGDDDTKTNLKKKDKAPPVETLILLSAIL